MRRIMSGHLKSLTRPIGARFSSSIRRRHSKRSSELEDNERLKGFAENLTRELQKLKPADGERILRIEWLTRVVSLALKEHNEAYNLIPRVDFPLSKSDETWMSEYLDATTTIMEVCNSVRSTISNMEHGHLLVKYAVCMLEKRATSLEAANLICARKSLQEWVEVVQYPQVSTLLIWAKREDWKVRLQEMLNGLNIRREKATAKGKGFLDGLYRAKTTAILACTALTLALSGKTDLSIAQVPADRFSSVSYLVQCCREEAKKRIASGSNRCVEEIEDVNVAVKKLLTVLNMNRIFPFSEQDEDEMSADVEQLKRSSEILSLEVEKLREQLDDLFHSIVASRSALLSDLQSSLFISKSELPLFEFRDDLPQKALSM